MKDRTATETEVEKKTTDEQLRRLYLRACSEGLYLERVPSVFGIDRGDDGWCFVREPVHCHGEIHNMRVSDYFRTEIGALRELPRSLELHRRPFTANEISLRFEDESDENEAK